MPIGVISDGADSDTGAQSISLVTDTVTAADVDGSVGRHGFEHMDVNTMTHLFTYSLINSFQ